MVQSTRWPVNAVALHPLLPVAAVGTGSYDGGYAFEGELLLLDLQTGRSASVLQRKREIRSLSWSDNDTLDVVASPYDDYEDDEAHAFGHAFSLVCDDWTTVPDRAFTAEQQVGPRVPCALPPGTRLAEWHLVEICADLGRSWVSRRQVWAVEPHGEGNVVAALEGVEAESWLSGGSLAWSVPDSLGGRQLHLAPDGRSVWATVPQGHVRTRGGWQDLPTRVDRLSLEDGRVLETLDTTGPVVVTASRDGRLALRDANWRIEARRSPIRLIDLDGSDEDCHAKLSGYDPYNHYFAIRNSPILLFLDGTGPREHRDKKIVTIEPAESKAAPTVRALFPLEWDSARQGHLFGGPGVYLHDGLGASVVHAGAVHDGAGLLRGNAFVVRRVLPDGEPAWVFHADSSPTAVDTDGVTVYAAFSNGELVASDARTGTVRWRQNITVGGVEAVALSLALHESRLLLGTWDGRILDCLVPSVAVA
ncbi:MULTISPECIES: PQQ-binding-like beta-propeller repeat protein [unclassified Streptomyces]|uniref:PQQ-binding-like beta-propeller repeat protein n=1 Tax=unclassified Streptomyces TaxID=2593676 RepID=UPI00136A0276|nr:MULTISPECIES: PQQ-binding-like beta-propeller repeat protein [unclassified Streptomyces]MYS23617.1 PQQ-binding-like beta-propeller repeat protein [Streptomyces sp. SID4948]